MSTLTRKKLEMDQRQKQILQLSREILLNEGYLSLSMERLASEMQFAKGTIYNHFPNKEDIVVALAIDSLVLRRKLFEKASMSMPGSRQRMAAVGCACNLYATHFKEDFAIEELIRNDSILERTSSNRQKTVHQCEQQIMSVVAGVVRDAVAVGDLSLPQNMSPEEFVFGFWALMYGSQVLIATSPVLLEIGVNDPQRSIRRHGWSLMNAYSWKPFVSFEETEQMMDALRERLISDGN